MTATLPPRLLEVAQLRRAGRTAAQIALELGVTRRTSKWSIAEVHRRLGVHSRAELVALAELPTSRAQCARCGGPLPRRLAGPGRQRERFCGEACARPRLRGSCLTCDRDLPHARGPRAYCSARCQRRSPRGDRRACAECRATFYVPRDEATTHCSKRCAWKARPWAQQFAPRRCAWSECDALFRPRQPRERFHALACRRAFDAHRRRTDPAMIARRREHDRDRQARRRAQELGVAAERVDARAILERDGGMCFICGAPVDRDLRAPDPRSAALGHVVPLAAGGGHVASNVRLAHRRCLEQRWRREFSRATSAPSVRRAS